MPRVGPDYPAVAWAGATSAPPVPTARRSTASAASSCQKLISKPASLVSNWHEAEPIYETRSSESAIPFSSLLHSDRHGSFIRLLGRRQRYQGYANDDKHDR